MIDGRVYVSKIDKMHAINDVIRIVDASPEALERVFDVAVIDDEYDELLSSSTEWSLVEPTDTELIVYPV
jgi:hypothetical protein